MSERFSDPTDQDIRTQVALSRKIVVSENVGDGVRRIKLAKLCMCTQKHYKHNEDGRTEPGVCGNGSVPLSHSGNVVTRIGIHTQTHLTYFLRVNKFHALCTNSKDSDHPAAVVIKRE